MGIWYEFYLDKEIGEDKWESILVNNSRIIYEVRGGFMHYFCDDYSYGSGFGFKWLSEDYKLEHKEEYEKNPERFQECNYIFYNLDLEMMYTDYKNQVHEYAGIISKNSYKHLQTNPDYPAEIIDESVYAQFKDDIKEHYMYYEWDSSESTYNYLYELIPIIDKALIDNGLKLSDVRLIYRMT